MKNIEYNNIEQLRKKIEKLEEKNFSLENKNAELSAKLNWFEEQYRLNQHKLYGSSSEKSVHSEQISIFNEAEALSDVSEDVSEPTYEDISFRRKKKKKKGHRDKLCENLPEETIEYKLTEEERVCECCGGNLHEMSTETRRELEVIPAQVKVKKHVKYIYSCRNCEKNGINNPIVTASMPNPVIPKSIASGSTISYVMVQKYMFGLPLYRQEQQWNQFDIEIHRQTMANWIINSSERWLSLIYNKLHKVLLTKDIIHADETTVQVLNEPGRAATTKSYMWVYRSGRDGPHIILFEYQPTRSGKHPQKFLEGIKGYLCVDGYDGYNKIPEVVIVRCFVHARRKFKEALKALPKNIESNSSIAQQGLDFCNKLFDIERKFGNLTDDERHKLRLEKSKPILDKFYIWLKKHQIDVIPKSATGKAINYCLNLWTGLSSFLLDGRLYIDNNITERSIKPFVIDRKNFLFCNTQKGATASAVVFSIIQTAKENNLKPFEYIKYLLEQLPNSDVKDQEVLNSLLPWSETLPDYCKLD